MHRATPLMTSFRAFTAGGARSVISGVDDLKLMQEMGGNFMKGETRSKVESPQNYGFTSVVMDADKDGQGNVTGSAEGFIQFCGGNRSFPVCGVMDDRRHRLKELEKGDVAMFRTKDDQQQFHLTKDGGYWSAPDDKTVRMQLVDKQQQQQSGGGGGGGGGGGSRAAGDSGGSGGGGQGGQQKAQGQKSVYKDGKDKSFRYVDVTKDRTTASGKEVHSKLDDKVTYCHVVDKEFYAGGEKGKHQFAKILTESGPSDNSYARIGGGGVAVTRPSAREPTLPKAAAALAIALVLGASLGMNYRVLADAWATTALACRAIASR